MAKDVEVLLEIGEGATVTSVYYPFNVWNYFQDNKTVLDSEDDAASVNWGGTWRMPTDAEWTELRTECTWVWTTQNGVDGRLVTGPNGSSIFLPAAGCWIATGKLYLPGSYGNYWSSSLDKDSSPDAWGVDFGSSGVNSHRYSSRCEGLSVRHVKELRCIKDVTFNSGNRSELLSGFLSHHKKHIYLCCNGFG